MDGSYRRPIIYFDKDGSGPHEHVCVDHDLVARAERWLERQRLLGLSSDGVKAVEQLIEDLS